MGAVSLLSAHDFWIAPGVFSVPLDTPVSFELRVGDHFKGVVFPRQSGHIVSFQVTGPGGESRPVPGLDGKSPAGFFRFSEPGLYIVSYRSVPSLITLEPAKFRSYLREEGLDRILEQLPATGSAVPVRESFSRCAKSLLLAGTPVAGSEGADRRIGLPLELVAAVNPFRLRGGGELPVTLYFEERPLEGALIVAMQKGSGVRHAARSDGQGRAEFALTPGVWLIKAVHMVPSEPGMDTQWHSRWASLTLEIMK